MCLAVRGLPAAAGSPFAMPNFPARTTDRAHAADVPREARIHLHGAAAVNRRQALAAMAASMALAGTACSPPPRLQARPYVHPPEAPGGTLPLYYATAFVRDGFAHGVLVGTQEGRPIKIEGNPGHPASLG